MFLSSDYNAPGNLPYTGASLWLPVSVGLLLLVIAGVVWCCLALGAVTDRRDGR